MQEKIRSKKEGQKAIASVRRLFDTAKLDKVNDHLVGAFAKQLVEKGRGAKRTGTSSVELDFEEETERHMGTVMELLSHKEYLEARRHSDRFNFDKPLHNIFFLIFTRAYGEAIHRVKKAAVDSMGRRAMGAPLTELGPQHDPVAEGVHRRLQATVEAAPGPNNLLATSTTNLRLAIEHGILAQCEKDTWERDRHKALHARLIAGVDEMVLASTRMTMAIEAAEAEAIRSALAARAKAYRKPGTGASDVA